MSCAFAAASGILWLCFLRRPVAPDLFAPVFEAPLGETSIRLVGASLLALSAVCWISRAGLGVGLALALVVMMAAGTTATFLMPRRQPMVGLLLGLCLVGWAISAISGT